eukprot:TRINITY_DN4286_c0_g1_i1.p1 TRINITY_DN4286_c0_g1~~TRINITY_DN4286_c0_g1_i1.p1  ORF type:complete len:140 (-),score=12.98 TRINITY_DN4286_c0_g1_i1:111-530(-)
MTYVLKMRRSVKGGGQEIYTLNDNGKQTKYGKSAPKINMSFYWDSMGPTIDSIIGAKEEGWDQIRIYYDMTSQPIYYIDVLAQDGRNRSFSIYGYCIFTLLFFSNLFININFICLRFFLKLTDNIYLCVIKIFVNAVKT